MDEIQRIRKVFLKRGGEKGGAYSCFFSLQREREIIQALKDEGLWFQKEKKVLDVGCGNGIVLNYLLKKGVVAEDLFGIDLLPERIKEAKRLYPDVYFTCGNAESLHFPDKFFDIIIQTTTFTSILDKKMKKRIASEMIRVLKPNRVIIWHDFRFSNPLNRNAKGIDKDEIMSLFPNCSFSFKSMNLNPLIGRPMARLSFKICEILEKIPILRTHLLVVIRKKTAC